MIINPINTVAKTVTKPINKVVPQPRMINGLAKDTFQKSSAMTEPKRMMPPNMGVSDVFDLAYTTLRPENKKKVDEATNRLKKQYGNDAIVTFETDKYSPNDEYRLKVKMGSFEEYSEFYDNDINKIGEEEVSHYSKKGQLYIITKNTDYRNNTTTKVRKQFDNNGKKVVTDEVRIIRDKNNNLVRKEMMTHSDITGAYNQKYVYPNGTEKVISQTKKFKKFDGMECIHKDMTSLDGTRTQYKLEQDNKGNKLLEYKITDKNGKVLMNLNKTMERVADNKVISSSGDKVYEMTFEPKQITIQEKGKEATVIPIKRGFFSKGLKLTGEKKEMADLLQKLPAEQLKALSNTVKVLNGTNNTKECNMLPDKKRINTINEVFSVLHETGHAIDFRHSSFFMPNITAISNDSDLRKIYTEEKDNFDKAYPNAQREHLDYFINQKNHYSGKWGGLEELVAETNALRDSYTTEDGLAVRVQYLQQHYPRTIAYINDKLENAIDKK